MSAVERPQRYDMSDVDTREDGLAATALAVRRGELVLLPTDTVYGIGCDAFDPEAVKRLLNAKSRGPAMPPPVLISTLTTMDALATDVPEWARRLTDEFWPGPLTLVLRQQSSLQWDLGDARGTVALRMPEHDIALDLIQRTGPLAVSSANVTGMPPALDADEAIGMLGDEVVAVLDSGRVSGDTASTIIDCTGDTPRLLRKGALSLARLRPVLNDAGYPLVTDEEDDPEPAESAAPAVPEGEVLAGEDPDDPPAPEDEHGETDPADAADPADVVLTPRTPAKRAPRSTTAKKTPAKKTAVTRTVAKKTAVKKTAVKKTAAKKAPAQKTVAKKTPATKAAVKRAAAGGAPPTAPADGTTARTTKVSQATSAPTAPTATDPGETGTGA